MKQVDIMEAICISIETKIFEEWRHNGFISSWNLENINFEVDGLEYVLTLKERMSNANRDTGNREDL